jgi:hypothetical protein
LTDLARPVVDRGIQVLRRQYGLRKYVAERRAQTASGWVDVALRAFEAELNGEIRFGMRAIGGQTQQYQQAAQPELNVSTDH